MKYAVIIQKDFIDEVNKALNDDEIKSLISKNPTKIKSTGMKVPIREDKDLASGEYPSCGN